VYNVSPLIQAVILYQTGCKVVVVVVVVGPLVVVVVVVVGVAVVVVVVVGGIVVVLVVVEVLVEVVVLLVEVVVVVIGEPAIADPEGRAHPTPVLQLFTTADPEGNRQFAVVGTAATTVILHPPFNPE